MSKGLFVIEIGEFGWQLMNGQGRARRVARENGYEHVVVCTDPSVFDLYRDFAHEFIPHSYPGIPLCQHRRITPSEPRINTHWLKTNGCKEYEPYKAKGYDILYPPEEKPNVRTTSREQDFIKFGQARTDLAYDVVMHARARCHMGHNNWPQQKWDALAHRLHNQNLRLAVIGRSSEAMSNISHTENRLNLPLKDLMDLMASSKLVIGPSSGPLCLASLCGTPHLVWFAQGRYAGATLRDRFLHYWNPLKTKCWPLQIGWQPSVDAVHSYVVSAAKELNMVPDQPMHTPTNQAPKENPRKRVRIAGKPVERVAVPNYIKVRREMLAGRAEKVRQQRARAVEARERHAASGAATVEPVQKGRTVQREAQVESEERLPELDSDYLLVRVAPGLGDFSWLYSKLCTLELPLAVQICGGGPQRLAPMAEVLPWVQHTNYGGLPFPTLRRRSIDPATTRAELLEYFPNKVIHMEVNTHLESGNRIEEWMPELKTNYHYDITITDERYEQALAVMPDQEYICIFASGIPQIRNWKGWDEHTWLAFILDFRKRVADMPFVLVGAEWDKELGARIEAQAKRYNVPFTNLTGALQIGASLYVIKSSKYFVSFPSGLGILADVMDRPATMFYSQAIVNMPGTYADPKNIESKQFHEPLFCSPADLVTWLVEEYDFKNKL